ncbi:MAG: hypothetical protein JWM67_3294 [Mycobacterium sp.]|nr:hypothetical protein [Mycobacterium sp.]
MAEVLTVPKPATAPEPVAVGEPLQAVLEDYEMSMLAPGCAATTITSRLCGVRLITSLTGADPRLATSLQLQRWLGGDMSGWTRATYFSHARGWFRFLQETGGRTDNPITAMRKPKSPRGVPRPLAPEVVEELLATTRGHAHMFVLLAAYAGLRVHEIAKLRGVDVTEQTLRVVGKGGCDASLPTHPRIWAEAPAYPRSSWWFPSYGASGHIQPGSVTKAVGRALASIGVDGHAHAHQLRHSLGTNVLKSAGGNLRVAQQLLRHSSPQSTAIYTMIDDGDMRTAVMGLPGWAA